MSNLSVDTLKDTAGNNSVSLADLAQTRANARYTVQGSGVIAINDSFNVGSVTDFGTGDYAIIYAVAFPNNAYAFALSNSLGQDSGVVIDTGFIRTYAFTPGTATLTDTYVSGILMGDKL